VLKSYRTSEVAQLTGLSLRQLDYWAQQKILEPSIQRSYGPGTRRLYSFDDIIQLRFIRRVRQQGWSTQKIREAITRLREVMEDPSPLKGAVLVNGKRTILAICKTREGERILLDTLDVGGQQVMWFVLETLVEEVQQDTDLDVSSTEATVHSEV
jgi:DNA-binding transcriptional MerR regulator